MFTKKEFEAFRADTEKALQEIAKKYDVNINAGKIKYTDNSFDLDLKVTKREVNGVDYEQAEFNKLCNLYGFKPEDYKKKFNSNGKTFTLIGFKTSARTMPIIAECDDGKRYKFGEQVKKLIA